jgi:hypothetical protein
VFVGRKPYRKFGGLGESENNVLCLVSGSVIGNDNFVFTIYVRLQGQGQERQIEMIRSLICRKNDSDLWTACHQATCAIFEIDLKSNQFQGLLVCVSATTGRRQTSPLSWSIDLTKATNCEKPGTGREAEHSGIRHIAGTDPLLKRSVRFVSSDSQLVVRQSEARCEHQFFLPPEM